MAKPRKNDLKFIALANLLKRKLDAIATQIECNLLVRSQVGKEIVADLRQTGIDFHNETIALLKEVHLS